MKVISHYKVFVEMNEYLDREIANYFTANFKMGKGMTNAPGKQI
jgi:hypothetical protein